MKLFVFAKLFRILFRGTKYSQYYNAYLCLRSHFCFYCMAFCRGTIQQQMAEKGVLPVLYVVYNDKKGGLKHLLLQK